MKPGGKSMTRYIGKEMSRVDGVAKVTGRAKYAAEFVVPLGDRRVVGWKRCLGDGQRTFGQQLSLSRLPACSQVAGGPAE